MFFKGLDKGKGAFGFHVLQILPILAILFQAFSENQAGLRFLDRSSIG